MSSHNDPAQDGMPPWLGLDESPSGGPRLPIGDDSEAFEIDGDPTRSRPATTAAPSQPAAPDALWTARTPQQPPAPIPTWTPPAPAAPQPATALEPTGPAPAVAASPPPVAAPQATAMSRPTPSADPATRHFRVSLDEAQTLLRQGVQHFEERVQAVVDSLQKAAHTTTVAAEKAEKQFEEIKEQVASIHETMSTAGLDAEKKGEMLLSALAVQSATASETLRKQQTLLTGRLLGGAAAVAAVTAITVVLTLSWSRPEWVLTERQEQEITIGREVIDRYHRSSESQKRQMERANGWQGPEERPAGEAAR